MTERPILFSGPMVRAILEGRKTQTRRLVRLPRRPLTSEQRLSQPSKLPSDRGRIVVVNADGSGRDTAEIISNPHGAPGDRLWVRETHAIRRVDYDLDEDEAGPCESEEVYYHATPRVGRRRWVGPTAPPPTEFQGQPHSMTYLVESSPIESGPAAHIDRWTPSIHMPRWASRIDLEIVSVRVERLQDITEDDAKAEGVSTVIDPDGSPDEPMPTHRGAFHALWNAINGDRATWESNPFVWAIEFRRVQP